MALRSGFDTGTHPQRAARTAATKGAGLVRGVFHNNLRIELPAYAVKLRSLGGPCQPSAGLSEWPSLKRNNGFMRETIFCGSTDPAAKEHLFLK